MKRLNLMLCLLLIINIFAAKNLISQESNSLSAQEAETIGANFFKQLLGVEASRSDLSVDDNNIIKSESGRDAIHVINYRNGGYVLVSNTKNAHPILAFSTEGSLNAKEMNPAAKMWINSYAEQIDYIINNSFESSEEIKEAWAIYSGEKENPNTRGVKSLDPIVMTKWNQDYPYNKLCPKAPNGPQGRVLAGCVATAMAQIMKYWDYPAKGQGKKGYHWGYYDTVDFNVEYNWANMPNRIHTGQTKEQVDEVARLIFHCAISADMQFSATGSGSNIFRSEYAYKNFFKYSSGMKLIYRDESKISDSDWKRTLIEDLDKKHPVLYRGASAKDGGHAFVCDGYKDDLYFHFNFGWSGSGDGYFYVDPLNSKFEKIQSDSIVKDFNITQGALFNIKPKNVKHCERLVYTQPKWKFDDGSGPNFYNNDSDCEWQINVSEPTFYKLKFNFTRFDLAEGDVLRIYEGNNNSGTLIAEFSNENRPYELATPSRNVFIKFETNSEGQAMGWEIEYESIIFETNDIEENLLDKVILYPNPVTNTLNIQGVDFDSSISILDVCGKLIYSESKLESKTIDLSNFSKGIYFVKLSGEKGNKTFKIIKD